MSSTNTRNPVTNPTWSMYHSAHCVSGPTLIGCRPGNLGSDEGGWTLHGIIYHHNRKTWRQSGGRKEGGRVVVMLGRSPYLHRSDWWGWGIAPVMAQLHQSDRMCLKDRAVVQTRRMKWFMLKESAEKQMMLRSWPCKGDEISSLLLILNDSLPGSFFFYTADLSIKHVETVTATCVTAGRG